MKILDLVEKVKESNPEKIGQMTDKKVALIIKESLRHIKAEIEDEDEVITRIPGLGNFKTKIMHKDGGKSFKKQILFNPVKK